MEGSPSHAQVRSLQCNGGGTQPGPGAASPRAERGSGAAFRLQARVRNRGRAESARAGVPSGRSPFPAQPWAQGAEARTGLGGRLKPGPRPGRLPLAFVSRRRTPPAPRFRFPAPRGGAGPGRAHGLRPPPARPASARAPLGAAARGLRTDHGVAALLRPGAPRLHLGALRRGPRRRRRAPRAARGRAPGSPRPQLLAVRAAGARRGLRGAGAGGPAAPAPTGPAAPRPPPAVPAAPAAVLLPGRRGGRRAARLPAPRSPRQSRHPGRAAGAAGHVPRGPASAPGRVRGRPAPPGVAVPVGAAGRPRVAGGGPRARRARPGARPAPGGAGPAQLRGLPHPGGRPRRFGGGKSSVRSQRTGWVPRLEKRTQCALPGAGLSRPLVPDR